MRLHLCPIVELTFDIYGLTVEEATSYVNRNKCKNTCYSYLQIAQILLSRILLTHFTL
jgi:hypothetical protein